MKPLRLHRLLPALLALSLVLTAATPLVRHACAMDEAATRMPCCEGGHRHDPAPPPPDAPPCHNAPAPEAPAPETPASDDCPDAHHRTALHAACCASVEAPATPAPERVELLPPVLAAPVAAFALPPEPPPSPPRLDGDLPPPAPVALHVLYELFLN